jgi:hypothetical protein
MYECFRQQFIPIKMIDRKIFVLLTCVHEIRQYYSAEKHDDTTLGEIGDKARSTAEEFLRVAKEKTDE